MSEKIADAINKVMERYDTQDASYEAMLAIRMFRDVAAEISTHTQAEPGGEESTEDKPF